ncbi:DDE-type integrase/transposase/recombinase [Vibrio spartinae]|uniref:DDE-type integrase/transposase/recombinase n=1 Tax=Vibrio spartinae TaxID=1918945 RepID=UPI003969CA8D
MTKEGNTVDSYLSQTLNQRVAKYFLGKVLRSINPHHHPKTLNIDRDKSYAPAIAALKRMKVCSYSTIQRQVKYLNNRIESDNGKLKRLIKPARGFQSLKTAFATIRGFEVMRMFRKGQFAHWLYGLAPLAEERLSN